MKEQTMPKPQFFSTSMKNIAATVICLAAAVGVCLILKFLAGAVGFGAVFLLGTAVVAEKADKYYGFFAASAGAVMAVLLKGSVSANDAAELIVILLAGIAVSIIAGRNVGTLKRAESEKIRADLLRLLAHDVRTPLASVKLSAGILAERGEMLTQQESAALISGMVSSTDQLILMTENILMLTSGKLSARTLKKRRESAEEIISEAALRFRRTHDDVAVISTVPEDPAEIMMDASLIEQVMQNLLENAAGHGEASIIEIILKVKNGFAEFRFSDNGRGISAELLEELFAERSVGSADTGAARSMGVGLSLCKTIIELHGGSLLGGNSDNGAEFTFTLPL